jgi:two-component system response regulator RstA
MTDEPRILVVEDDPKLSALVSQFLASNGIAVLVEDRGDRAVERILTERPDVVLLDIMLPGMSGLEICRRVRDRFDGAILMLTARGDDVDEVVGLELGADDYMAKPVRPRVLLARIRSLLRRGPGPASAGGPSGPGSSGGPGSPGSSGGPGSSSSGGPGAGPRRIEVGSLVMDAGNRVATLDGQPLDLTTAEYDLLWFLVCRAGEVLTREQLYLEVRGIAFDGIDRSIDLRISRLRRKLGEGKRPARIKSVRGTGYMLVADP